MKITKNQRKSKNRRKADEAMQIYECRRKALKSIANTKERMRQVVRITGQINKAMSIKGNHRQAMKIERNNLKGT